MTIEIAYKIAVATYERAKDESRWADAAKAADAAHIIGKALTETAATAARDEVLAERLAGRVA
jgi:hypothetical protein